MTDYHAAVREAQLWLERGKPLKQVIGIDFDRTLWDTKKNIPMPGAHEALAAIHSQGWKVLIHSCNNPKWIRKMCQEHDLQVEYVWGEAGMEAGKPVCAVYVDDRAYHFGGDWATAIPEIIAMVSRKPVNHYRGPVYTGNPDREAEIVE